MSSRDLAAVLDRPSSVGRDASASYLSDLGERLGLGERRVSEIERRARNKLRAAARGAGDGDGGGWAA